jgi:hypothetical protein
VLDAELRQGAADLGLEDYLAAFNARDSESFAKTLNFPHVRIASGTVRVWNTSADYAVASEIAIGQLELVQTGWGRSAWDYRRSVQRYELPVTPISGNPRASGAQAGPPRRRRRPASLQTSTDNSAPGRNGDVRCSRPMSPISDDNPPLLVRGVVRL